jgi:hypothetical protein
MLYAARLVDPASSHMLVSKIKPCMCVYNFLYHETANGSLNQLLIVHVFISTRLSQVILELTHDSNVIITEWLYLLMQNLKEGSLTSAIDSN